MSRVFFILSDGYRQASEKRDFLGDQFWKSFGPSFKAALEVEGLGEPRLLDGFRDFPARDPFIAATNDHFLFVRGIDEFGGVILINPNGAWDMALVENFPRPYVDDDAVSLPGFFLGLVRGDGFYRT